MRNFINQAVRNSSQHFIALATTMAATVLFSANALADIEVMRGGGANLSDPATKAIPLPFGIGEKRTSNANDEKFKMLRARCENDVGCGKASGDVCAEAAGLLMLETDVPAAYADIASTLRTRLALRLLERGVDSSNLAAARALDIYDKTDFLGIRGSAMPDPLRARELEEILTKRGYPGMVLRKARDAVSVLAVTATAAEKTQACQTATTLKAGGKLDADSVAIAEQILSSNYCEGLRPAAPEDPRARPNSY